MFLDTLIVNIEIQFSKKYIKKYYLCQKQFPSTADGICKSLLGIPINSVVYVLTATITAYSI